MSNRPNASAGPSRPPPKHVRIIEKTSDLMRRNEYLKKQGKGKGRAILGGVLDMVDASQIPNALQVEKFAETRALEILALQNAMKSSADSNNSRVFQSLPRHLRRRAASHNPRRVPKRLRSKAASEIDPGDKIAKSHRKRAKLRARAKGKETGRTEELLRRQNNKTWLPTHIYHAKRFHMSTLWGHRIPLTPTLKSFRPAYRASRRRATLQDVSFIGIIEISGKRAQLITLLGRMMEGHFAGNKYETGARMANVWAYHPDTFPEGLIGPVGMVWAPALSRQSQLEETLSGNKGSIDGRTGPANKEDDKRLWIRAHPAIFDQLWGALRVACEKSRAKVTLSDKRGEVGAFEIMGPLAGQVLTRVLSACKTNSGEKKQFLRQLGHVGSSGEVPEGMVVGLKVDDPRLSFPPPAASTNTPPSPMDNISRISPFTPSPSLASTSLWNAIPSKPRFKKSDLDRRRQLQSTPGTRLIPTGEDDKIPVTITQRSISPSSSLHPNLALGGTSEDHSLHGFTLIFPSAFSMAFLLSFIYTNVKLVGLAERRAQYRECGIPHFPEHWGGTCKAGIEWEEEKAKEEAEWWSRRPPGKRPEWSGLGIECPFKPKWSSIISQNDIEVEEEYINNPPLSDQKDPLPIILLSPTLTPHLPRLQGVNGPEVFQKMMMAYRTQRQMPILTKSVLGSLWDRTMLHVKVEMVGRGNPGDMAIIYSLYSKEREKWVKAYSGALPLPHHSSLEQYSINRSENPTSDITQSNPLVPTVMTASEVTKQDEEVEAYNGVLVDDEMTIIEKEVKKEERMLKLGQEPMDRTKIIGWVLSGNFSLARGKGWGIGMISLKSYVNAVKVSSSMINEGDGDQSSMNVGRSSGEEKSIHFGEGKQQSIIFGKGKEKSKRLGKGKEVKASKGNDMSELEGKVLVKVRNKDGRVCRLAYLSLI
ncbi:hypothetical protein TREMEDRAFT_70391 [Tremella mesenterica DSM 1558]|uniref:uncharacterized protein n=1 Tax=Tremella mesenterica (strain ATCC 24925 / CBS 8224 / DSM 1558 / NBRC 9311 / NRRL Y-6157 / RJB 2259-6 / UBC 559-6) TaxID=578456 RepID=UPI00032CF483|nr:uncharacterized protein TREMEDRAFT_70391 [Tremella mesenterica DSM 1558]EIW65998.1 hypothetical protein TREMEDRAFT_70391 [Tremella mesenterica DSM 1558]